MSAARQPAPVRADEVRESADSFAGPGSEQNAGVPVDSSESIGAIRRALPDERQALTHHFGVGGQEGYLTVGVYEDGRPGEIFINMSKQGSTISGLMDAFATSVSLALQYGVPLEVLCGKFTHMRFEPSGWSGHPKIGYANSIVDYVFRWLELKFLNSEQGTLFEPLSNALAPQTHVSGGDTAAALSELVELGDSPVCSLCGSLMLRSGACHRCMTCGSTTGCS